MSSSSSSNRRRTRMKRCESEARPRWKFKCEKQGFHFHTVNGYRYWNEKRRYELTPEHEKELRETTQELHDMCIAMIDRIIDQDTVLAQFDIPPDFWELVRRSWRDREPSLLGRFDLMYDGLSAPKLLEYNADAAVTLLETGVVQKEWQEDMFPDESQFNTVHDDLVAGIRKLNAKKCHFAHRKFHNEYQYCAEYMCRVGRDAGVKSRLVALEDIVWDDEAKCFRDDGGRRMRYCQKFYPWEWICRDPFGQHTIEKDENGELLPNVIQFIEPPWKMLLGTKAILPILYDLHPEHPSLLPATFDEHSPLLHGKRVISKPMLGRRGANIHVWDVSRTMIWGTEGDYDDGFYVHQQHIDPVRYERRYFPTVGSWVINDRASGISIREEEDGFVMTDDSQFIPHVVLSGAVPSSE